jgi:hypothetical protein
MIKDDHVLIWEAFENKHKPTVSINTFSEKFNLLSENQIEILAMVSEDEDEKNAARDWLSKTRETALSLLQD